MPLKRLDLYFDDIDIDRQTTEIPSSMSINKPTIIKENYTGLPRYNEENTDESSGEITHSPIVGRTPSDLIFMYIKNPATIPIVFLIISFLIFKPESLCFSEFELPLVAWVSFLVLYFGINFFSSILKKNY